MDVVGLLQFRGQLRAATGALVRRDCGLDRAMARFGRGLFVDRHWNLAGRAHPPGCGYGRLNVGGRSVPGVEPWLRAKCGPAFVGVRVDGDEGDYCDDAEYFIHDYVLVCCRRGGAASPGTTSAVGKPLAGKDRPLDPSDLPELGNRFHKTCDCPGLSLLRSDQFVLPPNHRVDVLRSFFCEARLLA